MIKDEERKRREEERKRKRKRKKYGEDKLFHPKEGIPIMLEAKYKKKKIIKNNQK